jgi:hypothetical protein
MAVLKYPERLLQPWSSLRRFSEELYAMFRAAGDDTDVPPDTVPAAAQKAAPEKLSRRAAAAAEGRQEAALPDLAELFERPDLTGVLEGRRGEPADEPAPRVGGADLDRVIERALRRRQRRGRLETPEAAERRAQAQAPLPLSLPSRPPRSPRRAPPGAPPTRPAAPEVIKNTVVDAGGNLDPKVLTPGRKRVVAGDTPVVTRIGAEPVKTGPYARRVADLPVLTDDPFDEPTVPPLEIDAPSGGGTKTFLGQVVSHTSGQPAKVNLFPDGPEAAPDPNGPFKVKIPTLANGETLPTDMWIPAVLQFQDADGNDIYYAQVPIWLA